jgi:hypothetical protein
MEHPLAHTVPLGMVGVSQSWWRPPVDFGGQLPAEVDRVQQANIEGRLTRQH